MTLRPICNTHAGGTVDVRAGFLSYFAEWIHNKRKNKFRKTTVEVYELQFVTSSEVGAVGIHKSVTPFTLSKY